MPLHSNGGGTDPHIKHRSSIITHMYYLATPLSLAPQFLHGANMPQYLYPLCVIQNLWIQFLMKHPITNVRNSAISIFFIEEVSKNKQFCFLPYFSLIYCSEDRFL
jgi:hypothetical protein